MAELLDLDAIEKTKEAKKEILSKVHGEVLERLGIAVITAKEARMPSIPMNKIEKYVKAIMKSGFNTVSCQDGLGPIVD